MTEYIVKCDFCGEEARTSSTYCTGDAVKDLSYDIYENYDYSERVRTEHFDICHNCLVKLRLLVSVDSKFRELFR